MAITEFVYTVEKCENVSLLTYLPFFSDYELAGSVSDVESICKLFFLSVLLEDNIDVQRVKCSSRLQLAINTPTF